MTRGEALDAIMRGEWVVEAPAGSWEPMTHKLSIGFCDVDCDIALSPHHVITRLRNADEWELWREPAKPRESWEVVSDDGSHVSVWESKADAQSFLITCGFLATIVHMIEAPKDDGSR